MNDTTWLTFLDTTEPWRSDLYRYCRHLTGSAFDADDLLQETLARALVAEAQMSTRPPNPRAWLFHVASNLWVDRLRRERRAAPEVDTSTTSSERATREAAGTLFQRLAPQERAAIVLKEAFDLSLEEISGILTTSVGAVKAALHRGRQKLADPTESDRPSPTPPVLDAFCSAFSRGDVEALAALLLETAKIDVVGVHTEYGPEAAKKGVLLGMLFGSRHIANGTGLDPRFSAGAHAEIPRPEVRFYRGEPVVLLWYAHDDGPAVRGMVRVELEGDRIAHLENYFYTPEVLAEVCAELKVPVKINGHRHFHAS